MNEMKKDSDRAKTVIVAGSQSISAKGVLERYATLPNTTVYGLSRRQVENSHNVQHISVDLLDPQEVEAKVGTLSGRDPHGLRRVHREADGFGKIPGEHSAVEKSSRCSWREVHPDLEHVTVYQGGKAYGSDLGPFKTPAREDDPRLMPPNFYYDQEDLLRNRQRRE